MAPKSKYGVEELGRDLRKQAPAPVYVVEGEESLLAAEAAQAIVEAVLPKAARDFNLGVFSGDDETGRQFLAEARSFPFLAERRVVLVRRFDKLVFRDREEEEFLAYLHAPPSSTVLVLIATSLDRRTTLAKELDKRARIVAAKPLDDEALPDWVRARCKARGAEVTPGACRLLVELAGPSLLDLGNEIEKLLARYPDAKRIEESAVESTVDRHRLESVWAMTRAFRPDNLTEFMQILARILETEPENEIFRLVGLMAWQVNLLLRIRLLLDRGVSGGGQIAARLKKNPWAVEQALPQARAFTRAQLLLWQRNLQRADVQMKSVALAPRWVLERALLSSFLGRELA